MLDGTLNNSDSCDDASGRVFFSGTQRSLIDEDVVEITSVGIDIGSSTSHMAISRLTLERLDSRYVVAGREIIHESPILLTPFNSAEAIDAEALGAFFATAFAAAGTSADQIDTGALILTGVAVRRANARAVGELFAHQAGKFVAVSAGDALETVMAAFGSGAAARSIRDGKRVLNIDIGGGTSKIALCVDGEVSALTAMDVGARLLVFDDGGVITRIEEAGRRFAAACGLALNVGDTLDAAARRALAARMSDGLFEAISQPELSPETAALLRLQPLALSRRPDLISFSGGVSEYLYGRASAAFGDLGPELADAISRRVRDWGVAIADPLQTIRATVIGASQYTVQLSGSTIYLSSDDAVPVRNVAVVQPTFDATTPELDADAIAAAVATALERLDLGHGDQPVAVCLKWAGSATFRRLHALGAGVMAGLKPVLAAGHPLILVTDHDVGGLLGIHCREEIGFAGAIISIDGIALKEFDFIDIGDFLKQTGAVPVVIKSLVFPGEGDGALRNNFSALPHNKKDAMKIRGNKL